MQTVKNLILDLQNKTTPPVLYAVQGDDRSRAVKVSLHQNGEAWSVPSGSIVSVAYKRPDGKTGWYNSLPDGTPAVEVLGSNSVKITFTLSVLSVPGRVSALVRIDGAAGSVSTFPFFIDVDENPSFVAGEISNDYYNVTNWDELNENIDDIKERLDALENSSGSDTNEKCVYYLNYYNGYGWDEFDFQAALDALNNGQILILRRWGVAIEPTMYYICTRNVDNEYDGKCLVFMGLNYTNVEEIILSSDGTIKIQSVNDTSALREDVRVLKSQVDSTPFKELTGTSSNPVTLRDLESGAYLIKGTIRPNSYSTKTTVNGDIFIVQRDDAYGYTYAYKFVPSTASIGRYSITNSSASYTSYKLSDIASLLSKVTELENRIAALEAK